MVKDATVLRHPLVTQEISKLPMFDGQTDEMFANNVKQLMMKLVFGSATIPLFDRNTLRYSRVPVPTISGAQLDSLSSFEHPFLEGCYQCARHFAQIGYPRHITRREFWNHFQTPSFDMSIEEKLTNLAVQHYMFCSADHQSLTHFPQDVQYRVVHAHYGVFTAILAESVRD